MTDLKIIELSGSNPDVVKLIGSFAMNPGVIREMKGYAITTNEDMVWFIQIDGSRVLGFGAIEKKKDHVVFTQDYTEKENRGRNIHRGLITERLQWCKAHKVKKAVADCTNMSVHNYRNAGFAVVKEFKDWTKVEKEI